MITGRPAAAARQLARSPEEARERDLELMERMLATFPPNLEN